MTAFFLSMVSSFVAVFALVPTLIVGIYAERAAIRTLLFYGASGAAIGLLVLGLYALAIVWTGWASLDPPSDRPPIDFQAVAIIAVIVALAGVAGGSTYWAIAGRSAGASRAPSATA